VTGPPVDADAPPASDNDNPAAPNTGTALLRRFRFARAIWSSPILSSSFSLNRDRMSKSILPKKSSNFNYGRWVWEQTSGSLISTVMCEGAKRLSARCWQARHTKRLPGFSPENGLGGASKPGGLKERYKVSKELFAAPGKTRKVSKSARAKATKRTVARAKPKRALVKKAPQTGGEGTYDSSSR
jgi:hypothetical protein